MAIHGVLSFRFLLMCFLSMLWLLEQLISPAENTAEYHKLGVSLTPRTIPGWAAQCFQLWHSDDLSNHFIDTSIQAWWNSYTLLSSLYNAIWFNSYHKGAACARLTIQFVCDHHAWALCCLSRFYVKRQIGHQSTIYYHMNLIIMLSSIIIIITES